MVSVLVVSSDRDELLKKLEEIEQESKKKNIKWRKARFEFRRVYIEGLTKINELRHSIFFEIFNDSKKYIELTSYTTAKAVLKRSHGEEYKVTVFVDGFRKPEIEKFSRGLRDLHIRTRKIRGVKKEENNAFIRLVDAVCGLMRDVESNNKWAKEIFQKLQERGIVKEL